MIKGTVRALRFGKGWKIPPTPIREVEVEIQRPDGACSGTLHLPNRAEKPVAKRHKDFFLLANANTFGKGADRIYVGRNQLDGATLDRFQMGTYDMDYDRELEAQLCPDKELRAAWESLRKNAEKNRIRRVISTRTLVDAYDMRVGLKKTVKECVEQLTAGWTQDEKRKGGVA